MNDDSSSGVPAGWYPDPLGLPQLRWWNGLEWTEHTTDSREPLVMQEPVASTRRERRERDDRAKSPFGNRRSTERTLLQLEPPSSADLTPGIPEPLPFDTPAGAGGGAFGGAGPQFSQEAPASAPLFTDSSASHQPSQPHPSQPQPSQPQPSQPQQNPRPQQAQDRGTGRRPQTPRPEQQRPQRGGPQQPARAPRTNHNGAVWTIALFPLFQLVFSLMTLSALGGPDSAEAMSIAMIVIWVAPYPVTIALAALDRAALRKAGRQRTAHWLWALLSPPVYLIARARASMRDSRGGLGPVLVWFLVSPLLLASIVVVPAQLIATMPATFSAEVEQSVMSDAALLGANLDVVCPPTPPTVVGQRFTCEATKDSGDIYQVDVSLQRANGWIAWRVDDWGIYTVE